MHWVEFNKEKLPMDDAVAMMNIEFVFYVAYMLCYNRTMMALREDPMIAAFVTAAMRDELNQFFEQKSDHPLH